MNVDGEGEENRVEATAVSKQTTETLMAGERIMEALDLADKERMREKRREKKRKQKEREREEHGEGSDGEDEEGPGAELAPLDD